MPRDLFLICSAAFLRSTGIGFLGVVLGVYLARAGYSSSLIGLVIAAGLAGAAVATLVISFRGDRIGRRLLLVVLAVLFSIGGLALLTHVSGAALLALAFVSMLNGMGTDRTPAFALEQAVIPGLIPDHRRTWALALYNVVLDSGHALGALAAGVPAALEHNLGVTLPVAYRVTFAGLVALNLAAAVLYLLLSRRIEASTTSPLNPDFEAVSPATRKIILRLAALFSLDAFGGGFLTDALVSYWFFRRFGIAEQKLAVLFFAVHILNALSHLGAAWLARRIGLLNTMVFTHLPSSLFLMSVPLAPSVAGAAGLFLARESLVEMDVPTRQSYVAAVVQTHERTYASGITNLARNAFWAAGSAVAGVLMQQVAFATPLVLGGGIKILYDVLLYRAFRRIKPPEERAATLSEGSAR